MNDLLFFSQSVITLVLACSVFFMGRAHRRDLAAMREEFYLEREKLLDRIMANNIHEFKTATGAADVTRSSTGNFLKDRMELAARRYLDE